MAWYSDIISLLTITLRGYQISIAYCCFSFLIESSSILQVTRTAIKSWINSKFGQMQPFTAEVAALDRLKNLLLT